MLHGKTALVTGSTSGIGLGIAEALDRLRARLAEQSRARVTCDAADVSRPDAIEAMMKGTLAEFGAVDVLVNNAGIQHVASIDEFPVGKWDAILAINLSAA